MRIRIRPIIPAGKVWDRIPKEDQNNKKGENQDALVFALLRFHTYDRAVYRTHYQQEIQYLTARKNELFYIGKAVMRQLALVFDISIIDLISCSVIVIYACSYIV